MKIILLDTSTADCNLTIVIDGQRYDYTWAAGRQLARGLLQFLNDKLALYSMELADIEAIGVMRGPGSFTGLRIGLTVLNTIASDRTISIVGVEMSDDWREVALRRLVAGENDELVMPSYGAEAHITKPRK